MIHKRLDKLRKYCQNFQDIENYEEAVKSPERYDLHHRKEIETLEDGTVVTRSRQELINMNMYWNRQAEELIFLKRFDHNRLHHKGKILYAETKEKLSAANTGEKNPRWKGDLVTDHQKRARRRRQRRRDFLSIR